METVTAEMDELKKQEIINSSLPFIRYTAYRLSRRLPPPLSVSDLVSVGVVGLLDALTRYTEGRVKMKTFLEYRIRGAMLDELRAQDWVPRSMKSRIQRAEKARRALEQQLGREPSDQEVAARIGLNIDEYYRLLQSARNSLVFSFEDFRAATEVEGDLDVTECIKDPRARSPLEILEAVSDKEALARLIDHLPEREKLVLSLYYWEELTMKEIGGVLGLSEGRICQIHNETLARLKAEMQTMLVC